jgi:PadR family transcriptional regulator PadR
VLPTVICIIDIRQLKSISIFVDDRDLYSGLIRLHILHHAAEGPIFGLWMAEELQRHGYRISAGTLYPLLHRLEKKGYLRSSEQRNGKSLRKVYRATPLGRKALKAAKEKVRELFGEIVEKEPHHKSNS